MGGEVPSSMAPRHDAGHEAEDGSSFTKRLAIAGFAFTVVLGTQLGGEWVWIDAVVFLGSSALLTHSLRSSRQRRRGGGSPVKGSNSPWT